MIHSATRADEAHSTRFIVQGRTPRTDLVFQLVQQLGVALGHRIDEKREERQGLFPRSVDAERRTDGISGEGRLEFRPCESWPVLERTGLAATLEQALLTQPIKRGRERGVSQIGKLRV